LIRQLIAAHSKSPWPIVRLRLTLNSNVAPLIMPLDENLPDLDQAALQFCIALLKSEPDASYRDARREARLEKGLSVRRQVWTEARREVGLLNDEIVDSQLVGNIDGPSTEPAPPDTHDHGAQPDPHEPERAQWPSDRRPAWAQPLEPRKAPNDPSPASLFPSPPSNPIEFMVQYLKTSNPEASFDEVRLAAEDAGHTIYPATFGRAQALAGILDDHVQQEDPVTDPPGETEIPRETPKPTPRAATSTSKIEPEAGFRAFMKAWNTATHDRDSLRTAMQRMLDTVQRALGRDQ